VTPFRWRDNGLRFSCGKPSVARRSRQVQAFGAKRLRRMRNEVGTVGNESDGQPYEGAKGKLFSFRERFIY